LKKELRDQIKQDEFASGLEETWAWVTSHRDEVRIGAGVAIVLLAAVGALAYFQSQRAAEADRAFRDALSTFEAPVTAELPPGESRPGGQVFASAEDRYKTAAAALEGVARRYGSSKVGIRAEYYAAISRMELKQYDEAKKELEDVGTRAAGTLEGELARRALADLYRRSGQVDKAVEAYRGLATNPSADLPPDAALWSAAQTLDDAKRYAEARSAYMQLVDEFPASIYASDARARATYLETAPRG
jgi:tetratricopeptide (TPR) repeat protein